MPRTASLLAALALLAACGDRGAPARQDVGPGAGRHEIAGTVARAGGDAVVIRPTNQPEVTLRVNPSTSVTFDGQPASAAKLEEGAEVRASYEVRDGGPTAVRIEAHSAGTARMSRGSDMSRTGDPSLGAGGTTTSTGTPGGAGRSGTGAGEPPAATKRQP
jgi:hypothetical protein